MELSGSWFDGTLSAADTVPVMPDEPEGAADSLAELRTKEEKLRRLMEAYRVQPATYSDRANFIAAASDFVLTGLGLYLEAAAKDRASAEADRISAKADRVQQEKDRKTMNILTVAIAGAAVVSAVATGLSAYGTLRAAKNPPAPIVVNVAPASAAAPIINVQPAPVTLSPPAVRTRPGRREPPGK